MSKEIQEFIEKLKDWKNNFPVQDYDYAKYNCEVANIAKWQKESNINEIINFWNEKLKEDYFELKHPTYNDVITRAVWSIISADTATIVFMIDKDNKYPWLFAQVFSLINCIITPNKMSIFLDWGKDEKSVVSWYLSKGLLILNKEDCENRFFFKNAEFVLSLQHFRPAHHFVENYPIFYFADKIKLKNKIFISPTFFIPKDFTAINRTEISKNQVCIRPTTLDCAIIPDKKNIFNHALQESLEDYHILADKDRLKQEYDLTIWLGFPGQRRAWLEQIEGTANILRHFNKYFKKIKVYVDGMTAYDGERQDFPENKVLFNKVVDATRKLFLEECDKNIIFTFEDSQDLVSSLTNKEKFVVFKSLSGYDYRTKICYCNDCNIVIGDAGTTALVPFEICAKSGVIMFGHPFEGYAARLHSLHLIKLISKEYLITKDVVGWSMNYHIPYQHIYNLAAEVLEKLSGENKLKVKNLKMHRLEVPPVKLIAKQYELEKQFEVKIPLENVEFVDKLATQLQQKDQIIQTKTQELTSKNQELESKTQELTQTKNQLDSTKQQLDSKTKELSS
ncbi:hypothetical protein BA919_09040, partial [Helicobacter pullorum]|uniref:hypothetical protein n=1 Tax=Helicobacter pullorum TaxID=35818 RepID=UPI0008168E23